MTTYRLFANSKNWGESDESVLIQSTSAELAVTKAKIIMGEDFYRRLYGIVEVEFEIHNGESDVRENWIEIREYMSYGMFRLKNFRDNGFKYTLYQRSKRSNRVA